MRIVVCVRQGLDGELSPFDASAYEAALRVAGAEVILLSMAPASSGDFLLSLTRLGAKRAVLLSDKAFAGADTLATAYTLSLAVKRLSPDLVFCGRQALVGDTAQTGVMLAALLDYSLITNVMQPDVLTDSVAATTRMGERVEVPFPALLTLEKIHTLRFPGIFSRPGTLELLDAEALGADIERCGLQGSPTRVLATYENESGKRKCRWIAKGALEDIVKEARKKQRETVVSHPSGGKPLPHVLSVGEEAKEMASLISKNVSVVDKADANTLARIIKEKDPDAVIWASDDWSKRTSALVAARLSLGLCADCTHLESDGDKLIMYRPALSGSIIAKVVSQTRPAMATVRTKSASNNILLAIGYGAKDSLEKAKALAARLGAQTAATRKAVDHDLLPYSMQVGLTGKTVAPAVYIAVGVSGAVHHIVGMQNAGTVIAINKDKDAPIFEYADYGILADIEEF